VVEISCQLSISTTAVLQSIKEIADGRHNIGCKDRLLVSGA
jgi:hypothetical protein